VKFMGRGGGVAYAVKLDGTVVGWGDNYCGRLSPKLANGNYPQPVEIPGLRNVTSIKSEFAGTIARDNAGTIHYWGFSGGDIPGAPRKLCDPNLFANEVHFDNYQTTEMIRTSLSNIVEVYVFADNFFALTADGVLYGWGTGFGGLLANSTGETGGTVLRGNSIAIPTPVPGLGRVRHMAFTGWTAFALQTDGSVVAWGDDRDKLLGQGTQLRVLRPTPTGLVNVAELTGTAPHGLRVLRNDGSVLVWGKMFTPTGLQSYPRPTPFTPTEPVRHLLGNESLNVLFTSGRVGLDVDDMHDISQRFR
jgi:alpha-tubulin suppressor-like RCC1 family protein